MIIDPNDPAHIESPKVAEARAAAKAAGVSAADEVGLIVWPGAQSTFADI